MYIPRYTYTYRFSTVYKTSHFVDVDSNETIAIVINYSVPSNVMKLKAVTVYNHIIRILQLSIF